MSTLHMHKKPLQLVILTGFLCLALARTVLAQGLPDFTVLVEENAPAIVNVSTLRFTTGNDSQDRQSLEELLRYFYGDRLPEPQIRGDQNNQEPERERAAMGSGFILSSDGYIVTNHHVVADADEIVVTLNDQREYPAEMIGSDIQSDLALLKIEAENLPQVKLGDSDKLKVGEWVLAIGSPFGLSYSVAAGIVSYIGRNLPAEDNSNYVSYIQTDVAINPGHSGGPLFNLQGEVVGINSQIFTNSGGSIGLSFAIPVDVAKNVINQLRDTGKVSRGWMGVSIGDVSQELAEAFSLDTPHGALINQVLPDSPAEMAGFKTGDVIVGFDGQPIRTSGDLPYHVGLTSPDTDVNVDIIRNGDPRMITMTVGNLEETSGQLSQSLPELTGNRLGLVVSGLDDETREQYSVENGVVVNRVVGGVGRASGFAEGDVLISINGTDIDSVAEFEAVVADLPSGRVLPVLVSRNGRQSFFTVRIPE